MEAEVQMDLGAVATHRSRGGLDGDGNPAKKNGMVDRASLPWKVLGLDREEGVSFYPCDSEDGRCQGLAGHTMHTLPVLQGKIQRQCLDVENEYTLEILK